MTAKKATSKKEKITVKSEKKGIKTANTKTKKASSKTIKAKKPASPKKPANKADNNPDLNQMSIEDCLQRARELGVLYEINEYASYLLEETSKIKIVKKIIDTFSLSGKEVAAIFMTILDKIELVMDIKASDFPEIKKAMLAFEKIKFGKDNENNAEAYLSAFKTCEKVLMIGQRKNVHSASEVSMLLGSDVEKYINQFFKFAYQILPSWQYSDIQFYEDFAFAILSQYEDLYEVFQLRILLDCADLYIKHRDFEHGDANYGYIIRENQIKDYIYYRFVQVYEEIDLNKAKQIAYKALEVIDERYVYYDKLVKTIEKEA